MDYALAKELKEANFPTMENVNLVDAFGNSAHLPSYAPTLSELIEACGELFAFVQRNNNKEGSYSDDTRWWAAGYFTEDDYDKLPGELDGYLGSTPEEAVGRLYLALHPKSARPQ